MRKIGLLGGTFDPPHFGHLILAQEVVAECGLDELWFLPSYIPPHMERKSATEVTPVKHRLEMIEQAIEDNDQFQLSLVECVRKGKSFTYDTLKFLQEEHPEDVFYFIIGADMVNDLPKWHRFEDVVKLVRFIAVKRPGVTLDVPKGVDIRFVDMPQIEISSSMIRERVKEKQPWRYFLPEKVKRYIEENRLYE